MSRGRSCTWKGGRKEIQGWSFTRLERWTDKDNTWEGEAARTAPREDGMGLLGRMDGGGDKDISKRTDGREGTRRGREEAMRMAPGGQAVGKRGY